MLQNPAEILKKIRSLPEAIQDFIFDPEGADKLESIFKEEKIDEKDKKIISGLLSQIFLKEVSVSDFLDLSKKELPSLPQETLKRVALKIAENRFLPLEDYLGGGVGELIRSLGVDPKTVEIQRVEVKNLTAEEAATEILLESGLKFEEPVLAKRVQEIIEMRLREVRDDLETVAALVRGPKIGGLGLDEKGAKKVIDSIKAKLLEVQIKAEEPKPEPSAIPISPISPNLSAVSLAEAEEEREVSHIKKEMAKKMADIKIMTVEDAIKKIIKETVAESKGDDYINKFRNILYARLRDVRDALETKEMLAKHPRLGGLGLTPEEAEKISNLIEDTFKALHQKKTEEITLKLKEEQIKLRKEKEEKQKLSKEKEEKTLDERWSGLTRKPVAADLSRRSSAEADKKFQPIKIEPSPVPEMPKEMEDIRVKKVLTGPIEELEQLTLSDFRKLSQIPAERARKIKGKVDLLAQEDITKKIAGATAWKKSEVMKNYFDILKESIMSGKPVAQIIKDKDAQKISSLTEEEFRALVELGRQLKI